MGKRYDIWKDRFSGTTDIVFIETEEPFGGVYSCEKCRHKEAKMEYKQDYIAWPNYAEREHILLTCKQCGYSISTKTADQ